MSSQENKRVHDSGHLRARHRVSGNARCLELPYTTVYEIEKCMYDGKAVNRRAGSRWNGVVDLNSLWDAI